MKVQYIDSKTKNLVEVEADLVTFVESANGYVTGVALTVKEGEGSGEFLLMGSSALNLKHVSTLDEAILTVWDFD